MAVEREHRNCDDDEEEPRIPVFTVLKNGAILKNIFIVNNSQTTSSSPQLNSLSGHDDQQREEILIIGRHPDCNIMLTHPSVSRFHLKVFSEPSLQKLSVTDLSSVHGTRISGKKIKPWERVELNEGDSLRIGGSSRVYILHWIPLGIAYNFDTPYVSASDEPIKAENEDETYAEPCLYDDSLQIENEPVEEDESAVEEAREESEVEYFLFKEAIPIPENPASLDFYDNEGSSGNQTQCARDIHCENGIFESESQNQSFSVLGVVSDPSVSLYDGSERPMECKEIQCDSGIFGSVSESLAFPIQRVVSDPAVSAYDGSESQAQFPKDIHCDNGVFGSESVNLALPFQRVVSDTSISAYDDSDGSSEPSLVADVLLDGTENQTPLRENEKTKESSFSSGRVPEECEYKHINRTDHTAECIWSLSFDEKQNHSAAERRAKTKDENVLSEEYHQRNEPVNSSFPYTEADFEMDNENENRTPQKSILVAASNEPIEAENKDKDKTRADQPCLDDDSLRIENKPVEEDEFVLEEAREEESKVEYSLYKEAINETRPLDLFAEFTTSEYSESLGMTVKEIQSAPVIPESSVYSAFCDNEDSSENQTQCAKDHCENGIFESETQNRPFSVQGVVSDTSVSLNDASERRLKCAKEIHCDSGIFGSVSESLAFPIQRVVSDTSISVYDGSESLHCDNGVFGSELENLAFPVQRVVSDTLISTCNDDNESLEPSLVADVMHDRTETQSPLREIEKTKELSFSDGEFPEECRYEHIDRRDLTTECMWFLSRDEKQENSTAERCEQTKDENVSSEVHSQRDEPVNLSFPSADIDSEMDDENLSSEEHHQRDEPVNLSFPSAEAVSEMGDEKENQTPQKSESSNLETIEKSSVRPEKSSFGSIWLRRGKPGSAMQLQKSKNTEDDDQENSERKVISKEDSSCSREEDQDIFTPDKENLTPNTFMAKSLKKKAILRIGNENKLITKKTVSCLIGEEECIFTPDKENFTPNTLILKSMKNSKQIKSSPLKTVSSATMQGSEDSVTYAAKETYQLGVLQELTPVKRTTLEKQKRLEREILLNRSGRERVPFQSLVAGNASSETPEAEEENENYQSGVLQELTPLKRNTSEKQKRSLEREVLLNRRGRERVPFQSLVAGNASSETPEAVEKNENYQSGVLRELTPIIRTTSEKQKRLEREVLLIKRRGERVPFQCLVAEKASSETVEKNHPKSSVPASKTAWNMVADITTLLNKESRKKLQLLRSSRRTSLIIPRMVMKELDCLRKRGSIFRRKTEACLALEWIEQCLVESTPWIHVQGSTEDKRVTAPTPPASPCALFSNESDRWSIGTKKSLPSLSLGSSLEIVSPTTEDHILECVLSCRNVESNGQLVLLSEDIALKVKAMAEGLLCESVQDFWESLVNPFSDRFPWSESLARGQTWSASDDELFREKYRLYSRRPMKKSLKGESAKGLKLILLHNSHYGQKTPTS